MKFRRFAALCCLGAGLALAGGVAAQGVDGVRLPTHGDWQAFTVGDGASLDCIAFSVPQAVQPEGLNRGAIAILVSHQLSSQSFNIVQIRMGYPLEEGGAVKVDIDGRNWELFGDGESAWPWDLDENAEILNAMKAGSEMYVEGRSQRGNDTMDRYSLSGITASMREIDGACGR